MGKRPGGGKVSGSAGRAGVAPARPRGNVKKKTNSTPKDLDAQEIPFKLREIMKSRMEMNKPRRKKKKPAQRPGPRNEELQTDIPVPTFKRKGHESVGAYLTRMNRETQHVMFLTKNQVERLPEMELDDKGELPQKEEPEVALPKKQKSDKKKKFDRKCLDKFVKKREEKKVARLEEEIFKDKVTFGEVVMEPPTLTVKPRKSAAEKKPGEKQLFLKKFFDKDGAGAATAPPASMARKRIMEEERERVVNAYRELKKRKQQQAAQSRPVRRPDPHHS